VSLLTPDAVRTVLASTIAGVTGIGDVGGKVYTSRRIARNDADVVRLFMDDTPRINAWLISFAPANAIVNEKKMGFNAIGSGGGGMVLSTFAFQIEAYYGTDDANESEATLADLVWSVVSTLNSYGKLIDPIVTQQPCQVAQYTFAMLLNKILTHYARLTIQVDGRTQ
jgi:hypothetical protein